VSEFRHRLRVRFSECDPQNVVFNARYLEYFDIGITELWRETIGPYEPAMEEHGVDMVVAEATIRYLSSLRFDEEFDVVMTIRHMGTTSLVTAFVIQSVDGHVAAEGELRHVFVDPGTAEKTPIPDPVREALGPYAAE
jgi:acyl-CoA thioester hydrolase